MGIVSNSEKIAGGMSSAAPRGPKFASMGDHSLPIAFRFCFGNIALTVDREHPTVHAQKAQRMRADKSHARGPGSSNLPVPTISVFQTKI